MMKSEHSEPLPRRRFDVAEVSRMAEAGVFQDEERLELIDGELIRMPLPGARHASRVDWMTGLLHRVVGASVIVRVQNPLHVDDRNLFLPDVALIEARDDFYENGYPRAHDVLLVVEIADDSFSRDRRVKLPRYAKAGVSRTWIVDVAKERVLEYSEPTANGYRRERACLGGDLLRVPGDGDVRADQLVGPPPR